MRRWPCGLSLSVWRARKYALTVLWFGKKALIIFPRYEILIPCLIQCGSLRSAAGFLKRASRTCPDKIVLASYRDTLESKLSSHFNLKANELDSIHIEDYPDKGSVRRELYPWNHHEPDRFSSEAIQTLNDEMTQVAPKLEVRVSELPVLK
jgi:hypothetical protein